MLRSAYSVGSLAGVPLRIHWSWAAVLLLVAGALSQLYGAAIGEHGAWTMALAAVLLLCASVVLHELGHALVARRFGLAVSGIMLFALGGVTEIADAEADPARDLLVAVAGPCVSLLLAIASGLGWWFAADASLGLLALHLALTNAAMALFNLLPGFPLDGGRVLWAVVCFLTDDELAAARVASLVGRVCGWALIASGAIYALVEADLLNGAWLVLVGYFLLRNAPIGYRRFVVGHALNGISVGDVMQRMYRAVAPELPLDQFVGRFVLGQIEQAFPVLSRPDADAPQPLLGMMTVRDLRRFGFNEWSLTRVGEAMTPLHRIRAMSPETPAGEALRALLESGEEQLPVIDGSVLLGLVCRRDLIRHIERRARVRQQSDK
jgi:Zn-dependent protease